MPTERPTYTERTPWAGWVNAVMWGAITVAAYPVLAGWDTDMEPPARLAIAGGIVGFGTLLHLTVSGMTVRVFADRVLITMGRLNVVRKTVPFDAIRELESVRYHPLREFGGWGVRGIGKKKAWTARGDQAVVLSLDEDRKLYIGSDHPQRLEERIRSTMGE